LGRWKLTKERAYEVTGIKTVYWLARFRESVIRNDDALWYYTSILNEHYRATVETEPVKPVL
jgi:Xaa-Pro aminopeptidase